MGSRLSTTTAAGSSGISDAQMCTKLIRLKHDVIPAISQIVARWAPAGAAFGAPPSDPATAASLPPSAWSRAPSSGPTWPMAATRTSATGSQHRSSASGTRVPTTASWSKIAPRSVSCTARVWRKRQLSVSALISSNVGRYLRRSPSESTARKAAMCAITPTFTSSRSFRKWSKVPTSSASAASRPRTAASAWSENESVRRTFHCRFVVSVRNASASSDQRAAPTACATPGKLYAQ